MSEELRANGGLPQGVVREDRKLEAATESASEALAKHEDHYLQMEARQECERDH